MNIKAIETRYKGYRFRSRLEARWAVFFERAGVEWVYEPQGFKREWHEGKVYSYLPDFRIKIGSSNYWVEVKGNENWLKDDWSKIEALHDWGGCLPGFEDNGDAKNLENGLIILGEIPEPIFGVLFLPVLAHRKGIALHWRAFVPEAGMVEFSELAQFHFEGFDDYVYLHGQNVDFQPKIAKTPKAWDVVTAALRASRSARFEHGETP